MERLTDNLGVLEGAVGTAHIPQLQDFPTPATGNQFTH